MWRVIRTDDFIRQAKWYAKKRQRELAAVTENLTDFLTWLDAGHLPRPLAFGFLHDEPAGVIAIDQSGAPTKLAATRLYLHVYVERETVYLLTIGDKRSQNDDIQHCKRFVEIINANPDFGVTHADEDGAQDVEQEE
jgi:hypothetical protein